MEKSAEMEVSGSDYLQGIPAYYSFTQKSKIMARQNGIIKIDGTLENLTFYKTQDGNLVKTKSGVSADRIANDPNFQRTRENGVEFGNAATAGKLLRDSVRNLMMNASDNRITSRITQVMTDIKNMDTTSVRGKRTVAVGIGVAAGRALLKGLNFNDSAILGAILYKPYVVNTTTGVITIAGLVPQTDIAYPTGATHLSLTGAMGNVNFATGIWDVRLTNIQNLAINTTSTAVTLTPTALPAGTVTKLFLIKIEFFQLLNAVQYPLKSGAYNTLAIIETA